MSCTRCGYNGLGHHTGPLHCIDYLRTAVGGLTFTVANLEARVLAMERRL